MRDLLGRALLGQPATLRKIVEDLRDLGRGLSVRREL
jgi:hypothetical protein